MNIVIPIAAINNSNDSTEYIRSLYEIEHKIAFQHVYESLNSIVDGKFIIIIKRSDTIKFHFDDIIRLLIPNAKIIVAEGATCGSACTCMLSVDSIDNDEEHLVANCDYIVTRNWQTSIEKFRKNKYDGGIIIFDDIHPKWSFVKLDDDDLVVEAAEKRPISRNATTGHYYYKHGSDFVKYAKKMIKKGASVHELYYCCPIYNEMILEQKVIGVERIEKNEIFSLKDQRGIEEYRQYLKELRNGKI